MKDIQIAKMFGGRLREMRKARGLTLDQLAESASVSSKHLGEVERGQANVTLAIAANVAAALGCEISELFRFGHKASPEEIRGELQGYIQSCGEKELEAMFRFSAMLREM